MLSSSIADHFRRGAEAIAAISDVRPLVHTDPGMDAHTGAQLYEVDASRFVERDAYALREECFGPVALVVRYDSTDELRAAPSLASEPALTFNLFCVEGDPDNGRWLLDLGAQRSGRVIVNGFPTGVGVSWSMQHGGPWPSTTSSATTSVRGRGDRALAATGDLSRCARRTTSTRTSREQPSPHPTARERSSAPRTLTSLVASARDWSKSQSGSSFQGRDDTGYRSLPLKNDDVREGDLMGAKGFKGRIRGSRFWARPSSHWHSSSPTWSRAARRALPGARRSSRSLTTTRESCCSLSWGAS